MASRETDLEYLTPEGRLAIVAVILPVLFVTVTKDILGKMPISSFADGTKTLPVLFVTVTKYILGGMQIPSMADGTKTKK
jgi:hypothetical protein